MGRFLSDLFRVVGRALLTLLLVGLLILAALPSLLSTKWGQRQLIHLATRQFGGEWQVDDLSFSWFGGQKLEKVRWIESGQTRFAVDSLTLNLSPIDLLRSDFKGEALFSGLSSIWESEKGPIPLTDFSGKILFTSPHQPIVLKVNGRVAGGDLRADIDFRLDRNWQIDLQHPPHFALEVRQLPTTLLNYFITKEEAEWESLLPEALGETVDLSLNERAHQLTLTLSSPLLKGELLLKLATNRLQLIKPALFNWQVTPKFFSSLTKNGKLLQPVQTKITLEAIDLPLQFFADGLPPSPATFAASAAIPRALIAPIGSDQGLLFESIATQIQGTLEDQELHFTAAGKLAEGSFTATALFAKPDNLSQLQERLSSPLNWSYTLDHAKTQTVAPFFPEQLPVEAFLGKSFQLLFQGDEKTARFTLRSDKLQITDGRLTEGKLTAAALQLSPQAPALEEITVSLTEKDGAYAVDFNSHVGKGGVTGSVTLSGRQEIEGELSLTRFPFNALPQLPGRRTLALQLGETVDLQTTFQLTFNQEWEGGIQATFKSQQGSGELQGRIGEMITIDKAAVQMTLTPNAFEALRFALAGKQPDRLRLLKPSALTLSVNQLNLPRDLCSWGCASLSADATIDRLFIAANGQRSALEGVVAKVESLSLSERVRLSLKDRDNSLVLDGDLHELFNREGTLQLTKSRAQLQAHFDRFPALLLIQAVTADSDFSAPFHALVGQKLNGDLSLMINQGNGQVKASLYGDHGQFSLDGRIEGGFLKLNTPLTVTVKATPQLGEAVLAPAISFLSPLLGAEEPLNLTIDPQDFAFPLFTGNIAQIQIGKASFSTGKMRFANRGELRDILTLITPSLPDEVTIWVTPIYFSQKNGVVKIERTDCLVAGSYPIASWGNVDLVRDQVKMVVGIRGASLRQILGVRSIDDEAMLQLPLRGKVGKATINRTKAASQITSLLAKAKGGAGGLLVGALLDLTGSGYKKPPPPTTTPLPWERGQPPKKRNLLKQLEKTLLPSF